MGVKMNIEDTEFLEIAYSSTSRFGLWQKVINATNAKTLVEVGVWKGDFAKEVLEKCENIEKSWQHDIRFEPTLVCPFSIYFAEAMELPIFALPFNQFLIQKRPNSQFSFVDSTGRYSDISLNKLPPSYKGTGIKTPGT
jgi:hypothetical protein